MPSFQDSIFLFILALILFGPKRLPQLARELGKWVGEFRRASNEFKMQMEEEMRQTEQAERMKKIEAMEAAAPQTPALNAAPAIEPIAGPTPDPEVLNADGRPSPPPDDFSTPALTPRADGVLPIATEGELSIMPPATGLPTARTSARAGEPIAGPDNNPLGGLIESIPQAAPSTTEPETTHAH